MKILFRFVLCRLAFPLLGEGTDADSPEQDILSDKNIER